MGYPGYPGPNLKEACPDTTLYPEKVSRTPQGQPRVSRSRYYDASDTAAQRPDDLPDNTRGWPWYLGATLRPQARPNGGGSTSLAAELSSLQRPDSGRYGSYTGMDVWVPPELGDDLKTVEEIMFLAKNRALESKLISEEMDVKSDVRRAKWDTRSNQSSPRRDKGSSFSPINSPASSTPRRFSSRPSSP
mmetsp:Transcript_16921/g.28574  ORF Transcript_16921/g.28574 Transcript_16921/m.28574 type:complete len:190 (+) Transcript_16921:420-989(+)